MRYDDDYDDGAALAVEVDDAAAGVDTARLWISDRQWLSILRQVQEAADGPAPAEESAEGGPAPTPSLGRVDRRNRTDPRRPWVSRCVMRLAESSDEPGTFVVRTRDISSGGMAFSHHRALHPGTRCTLAIEAHQGFGMIVPARVRWCRRDGTSRGATPRYFVGLQFDRPIDLGPVLQDVA